MHGSDSVAIDSLRFFRADFFIQIIHQSLVFCDKLWASFPLPALDFEQSLYQMREVFHIPLQWLVANKIGESRGQNCSKLLISSLKCSLSRLRLQSPRVSSVSFAWLVVILPETFSFCLRHAQDPVEIWEGNDLSARPPSFYASAARCLGWLESHARGNSRLLRFVPNAPPRCCWR
jgi:hypothetical protein